MKKISIPGINRRVSRLVSLAALTAGIAFGSSQELELRAVPSAGYKGNTRHAGIEAEYYNAIGDDDESAFIVHAGAAELDGIRAGAGVGYRFITDSDHLFGANLHGDFYGGSKDREELGQEDSVSQLSIGAEWHPLGNLGFAANAYFSNEHTGFDGHASYTPWVSRDDRKRLDLIAGVYNFKHKEDTFEDINNFEIGARFKFPIGDSFNGVLAAMYFNDQNEGKSEVSDMDHSSVNQFSQMRLEANTVYGLDSEVLYRPLQRTDLEDLRFVPIGSSGVSQDVISIETNNNDNNTTTTTTITTGSEPAPTIPAPTDPTVPDNGTPTIPPTIPPVECPDGSACSHPGGHQ